MVTIFSQIKTIISGHTDEAKVLLETMQKQHLKDIESLVLTNGKVNIFELSKLIPKYLF